MDFFEKHLPYLEIDRMPHFPSVERWPSSLLSYGCRLDLSSPTSQGEFAECDRSLLGTLLFPSSILYQDFRSSYFNKKSTYKRLICRSNISTVNPFIRRRRHRPRLIRTRRLCRFTKNRLLTGGRDPTGSSPTVLLPDDSFQISLKFLGSPINLCPVLRLLLGY